MPTAIAAHGRLVIGAMIGLVIVGSAVRIQAAPKPKPPPKPPEPQFPVPADDNDVTDAARAKTPEFLKHLKASQIAAYLAVHAEEVADPAEQMIDSLNDLRSGESDDPDGDAQDSADDIAHLVAGLDSARAEEVSAKVLEWFKANRDLKDEQFEAKKAALEESAKRIVGDIPAMT